MPAHYTDITVLLDRSASMKAIQITMNSALDEFVLGHQAVPSTKLTLVQFDDIDPQEVVYEARTIGQVPKANLQPRGNTPLLDALCRAIDSTGKRFEAMAEPARPDQVLFVIITDGEENASREFTRQHVRERIERQTGLYQWQFVYLGANQDVFKEAASLGIDLNMAMAYAHNDIGTRAAVSSTVSNTVAYAQQVNRGSTRSLGYSVEQRKEAAVGVPVGPPTFPTPLTDDEDDA